MKITVEFTEEEFAEFQAWRSSRKAVKPDDSIAILGLSVYCDNLLRQSGYDQIGDLLATTRRELKKIPNFGPKSLDEVQRALEAIGLTMK